LGLPTPEGRLKKERFQPIRERLGKRMAAWSEKHLSAAAKEVLIKAVGKSGEWIYNHFLARQLE
jgi:predicted DNA-binding transcriptional regulator AlpA